jgi:hypothetical protein
MLSEGFEPAIPAIERLQTYVLDGVATGMGETMHTKAGFYIIKLVSRYM